MSTGISWTDDTWNPTVGCARVSPGCDGCYAIRDSARLVGAGVPAYLGVLTEDRKDWSGRLNLVPARLDQPLRWQRPRRIFVNSMSDLFHPDVPVEFIADVFATMALAQHHQFQVLTKRPQRMAEVVGAPTFSDEVGRRLEVLAGQRWSGHTAAAARAVKSRASAWRPLTPWPLPNVWLGTSIESQTYAWRARHVLATPAAVRFVSAEPLLGALNLAEYLVPLAPAPGCGTNPEPGWDQAPSRGLDWIIIGGESGTRARPMELEWVESLVAQCRAAGAAPFVKQLGHVLARALGVPGKGTVPDEWPEAIRARDSTHSSSTIHQHSLEISYTYLSEMSLSEVSRRAARGSTRPPSGPSWPDGPLLPRALRARPVGRDPVRRRSHRLHGGGHLPGRVRGGDAHR